MLLDLILLLRIMSIEFVDSFSLQRFTIGARSSQSGHAGLFMSPWLKNIYSK